MYSSEEHAIQVKNLQQMDREQILATKIRQLVAGVRNGELSVGYVTRYTSISEEQLSEWMEMIQ
ncbi:hypothetical protein [Paenibacillus gansuensis]|uniref:Uncharacterized protein n=1 Tax=Paenibacillus gansuensis TaxID=306542 RepID=A0ABW5PI70_9BACL